MATIWLAGETLNATTTQTKVWWQTWKRMSIDYPFADPSAGVSDPGASTLILKGRSAAGVVHNLYNGTDGVSQDGDLIELGYYKTSAGAANEDASNYNPHRGTWTPLSTKTTIGHKYDSGFNSDAGEFYFTTLFTQNASEDGNADLALTNNSSTSTYQINDDGHANLSADVGLLDAASTARLGIRFYDIGQSSTSGGLTKVHGNTRYNTIMLDGSVDAWKWIDTTTGLPEVYVQLHNDDGSVGTTDHVFEFENSAHNAYSKVGTGAGTSVGTDDYVASITYHDGASALALDTVGSVVLSGLSGSGNITDGGTGKLLTLHTASGNMLVGGNNDGTSFSGDISGDITIIKTGGTAGHAANDGEQTLTGSIAVTDSTGYLDLKEGTLILAPASGKTQSFEYITGAGNLDLVNDNGQTVELGFTSGSTAQTHSGTVELSGTGTATTIKVSSGTAGGDYNDEQVFSGQVTGTETLVKSGVGRLKLSNSGNNFTNSGGTDVQIDDGTLVAAHANALGGASNTVVINKGKLELEGGISLANTSIQGSASGKSMVGGDGTFSAITVGDGTTDIKAISPGRGISSSLSPSNQQVTLGTGGSAANAMGNLTVTSLTFNDNAVFDWEISDFNSGANQSSFNDEFDVLNFDTLTFGSGAVVDLNIFSVASDGSAGGVANLGVHDHTTNDGIIFLKSANSDHNDITWGGAGLASGQWSDASSYFNVDDRAYNFHNGNLHGGWGVWYNGSGDFYLRYSAVPEPSTYVMVTGLLLLPGFRLFRRFRKGFGKTDDSEESSTL